jgi:DNA-binding NarL/FixJ family response regulator
METHELEIRAEELESARKGLGMRLALIDDHPILTDALSLAIASIGLKADCFVNLAMFDEAVANGERFDLVVLDLALPGFTELAALDYFREWHDDIPVVVMSATQDRRTISDAVARGAMGFIPKTSPRPVLLNAIQFVASGGIYIPVEALVGDEDESPSEGREPSTRDIPEIPTRPPDSLTTDAVTRLPSLTARQNDVLGLLLKGMPNKLICRQLGLSPNTVKSHVSAIFRVLEVDSRTKAVIAAQRRGIKVDFQPPQR